MPLKKFIKKDKEITEKKHQKRALLLSGEVRTDGLLCALYSHWEEVL